ncbi:CRAL/TRIO domain containing protein, putative [Trypanosoma equiperdum]|uniref:CRAL-TRIO domain-containing protein n=4 Tax=Trypanozoon TaxID=39700 RepID=Q57XZ6_TRYB2|nr:hypothetical protein, conserved [Trypanosoma brucei brucei TREU927]AAX69503.1 hypothetical protein, conserved [Trypanosoma brucei]RHW72729.1 CRAL/TRIO domain containing protein [Trypanosoma brucei equiperdum]SCU64696.1 CRAL/TRIO domain containing protein, putative [Trypanosoma equiperdum]AAX80058.1 hypothetical protein Tb04.30K5.40 [Trypanosoma brucei]AAZ10983.1 hypothetical protein, conserved [Trypanosoma brucei brucei TREU927]
MSSFLQELGPVAVSHRQELEEVKRELDIKRDELDCWIYGFLENKKFDVKETVAKLQRRFAMEVNEMAKYEFTEYMRTSLRLGIIQVIGEDKCGRTIFYVTVNRDKKAASHRDGKKHTFDLMVSYGTRLRADNKRCQMVLLVNYEDASMWSNVDMSLQADVALRISKFFPGCISKVYICNMGRMLCSVAKPLFSQLPSAFSDSIMFFSKSDRASGRLLEFIDESVLPVQLGGTNDCDNQEHWDRHGDIIEDYYHGMKAAISERGLTVKEWELQCIEQPNVPVRHPSLASETESMVSLLTFGSSLTATPVEGNLNGMWRHDNDISPPLEEEENEWCLLMKPLPNNLSLFFLEELYRWRVAVSAEEGEMRCALMDDYAAAWKREFDELPMLDLSNKKWYRFIPESLRELYHGVLIVVNVASSLSFLVALLFFMALTSSAAVTVFLAFFIEWNYVYALFATLILVTFQGTALCSRAVTVLVVIMKHKVVPPLDMLGKTRGSVAQLILFCSMIFLQMFSFGYSMTHSSLLRSIQVTFATGWLFAVAFLALCHIVLFFDWIPMGEQRRKKNQGSMLALYLLLDVQESEEKTEAVLTRRLSTTIACAVPITLDFLLGIAFIISGMIPFAVATCIATVAAILTIDYCSLGRSSMSSRSVLRSTVAFACMLWLYLCFSFRFLQYDGPWIVSVCTVAAVNVVFISLAVFCLRKRSAKKTLRGLLFLFVILLITSCTASFFLVGSTVGVISLVLLIHSGMGIFCVRRRSRNIGGTFIFYGALAMLALSCVLLGWLGAKWQYWVPHSLPPVNASGPRDPLEEYHQYPICTLRTAGGFGIVDFALLTEVSGASKENVFHEDFDNWFGSTDVVYNNTVKVYGERNEQWSISRFDSLARNVTVLTLQNGRVYSSIITMTVWIGYIALAPLQILLPNNWLKQVAFLLSFLTRAIDFTWYDVKDEVVRYLTEMKNTTSNEIVLTAWGIAGGIASLAGVESHTQTITFGSPGLMDALHYTNYTEGEYHKYVLAVVSELDVLNAVTRYDPTTYQRIQCSAGSNTCGSMNYISSELVRVCDTTGRRHVGQQVEESVHEM